MKVKGIFNEIDTGDAPSYTIPCETCKEQMAHDKLISDLQAENKIIREQLEGKVKELSVENIRLDCLLGEANKRIEELEKIPSDIEHLNKMSEQYSAEFHKALKQEREKRYLIKQQLIKELREAGKIIKSYKAGFNICVNAEAEQFLAKLDLLERGIE